MYFKTCKAKVYVAKVAQIYDVYLSRILEAFSKLSFIFSRQMMSVCADFSLVTPTLCGLTPTHLHLNIKRRVCWNPS